ncbi:MAG: hypothetical protein OEV40_06960 [Acidimicrobiia bacterium]|nr:hypothetical protein [Acidimicrobiia bacterium]
MTTIPAMNEAFGSEELSFDRCVDWLLTLHESTTDPQLQRLAIDVLAELRELGPGAGEFADVVLGALASVEVAFEIAAAAA